MSIGLGLGNQPRISYGVTTLNFSRPAGVWRMGTKGVGAGREVSAAGIPSVWTTRRDYTLTLPLRFTEAEWPSVRAWLVWAIDGGAAFTFRPDQDVATAYTVYLDTPSGEDPVEPTPREHPGELELTVTLRTTTGIPLEPAFFG